MHSRRLVGGVAGDAEPQLGVERRVRFGAGRARSAGSRRCRATCAARSRNTSRDQLLRRHVALAAHRARVLVLDLGAAFLELLDAHVDALQDVERLEAGDDDRHAVLRRERLVLGVAHHRADVAGREEALHAVRRATTGSPPSPAARARARPASRNSSTPARARLEHRHRVGRRGRLEADGEEHDLAIRVLARDLRPRRAANRRCARRRRRP